MVYCPFSAAQVTVPETSGGTMLFMRDDAGFRACGNKAAARHLLAWLHKHRHVPKPVLVQAGHTHAAGDKGAVLLCNSGQRALDAVENILHDARAQRGAQRRPVPRTGSPTFRPAVSSYTWMVVFSEVMPMTSPMSPTSPTYTISIMEKPRAPPG